MDHINETSRNDFGYFDKKSTLSNEKLKNDKALYAIQVKRLTFSYSESKSIVTILNRLTLNVPLGAIYALLGPSGCGKTTLIRSILGLLRPESGEIRLFHRRLGSKNSHCLQIPGKDCGYMPQDYALYNDLTILEQLNYHRALHNENIGNFSIYKLIDTLELGDQINQLVSSLSGGQARRLSFACAMIHRPRLLILDEPTVGVDPLLRRRLWQILSDYVNDFRSVLITTHYIEEARKANVVGLMRRGFLLAEDNPENLIKRYKAKNLEDVFFKLCVKQKRSKLWKRTLLKSDATNMRRQLDLRLREFDHSNLIVQLDVFAFNEIIKQEAKRQEVKRAIEYAKTKATIRSKKAENNEKKKMIDTLLKKRRPSFLMQIYNCFCQLLVVVNRILIQTKRQKPALFAQFILPLISILLFYFCVGDTPKDVQIAIVNEEASPYLSSNFLSNLNPKIIKPVNYSSLDLALESVRRGTSWAVLRIRNNFSNALMDRIQYQADSTDELTNETLVQSTIVLNADMTNKILFVTIQRSLDLSIQKLLNATLVDLGYRANLISLPLRVEEVIYGSFYSIENDDNYYALKDYGLSGILIILNYTMSFGLTVLVLAEEKKEQMLERSIATGLSSTVIISGHLIVRILLCNFNVALLLCLTTQLFHAPILTQIQWPFALLMIQSLVGLSHGMLISAICNDFFMCAVLSNGVLLMVFILSGVLWSVESLPTYLRFISSIQPTTAAVESLRWMLSRGHDIYDPKVYNGFITSVLYFFIFFLLASILFKKRQY